MKRILYLLLVIIFAQTSCKKDDHINISHLQGKWSVVFDDPNLIVDSSVSYQFNSDLTCTKTIVQMDNERTTYHWHYVLSVDNTLVTLFDEENIYTEQYTIVKLNDSEMNWENASSGDGKDERVKLRKY